MSDKGGHEQRTEEPVDASWQDDSLGTRDRVALWLIQEIGVGGVFTKSMLREAFPGVEQIDRRMRDLRPYGWQIDTARQDPTLKLDELRLVERGASVWKKGHSGPPPITARVRNAVLHRDHFCCVDCGIAAGEPHPETPLRRAQLSASRRSKGDDPESFVTLCDMCRRSQERFPAVDIVVGKVARLTRVEREELLSWLVAGTRPRREIDVTWALARRLSPADRAALMHMIESALSEPPEQRGD